MDWISALIGAGANLLSGFFGSSAANNAASSEAAAAHEATQLQASTIAQARADAAPWLDAGKKALAQLQGELGMGGPGFQSQFQKTPGYDFQQSEGNKGVINNLKALGLSSSGAALKALTRFNSNLANQTYNQYLDRLSGVSTGGQTTSANTGAQSITGAQGIGQSIMDQGAATASGYVGAANSWINALGNTANGFGKALGSSGNSWKFLGA